MARGTSLCFAQSFSRWLVMPSTPDAFHRFSFRRATYTVSGSMGVNWNSSAGVMGVIRGLLVLVEKRRLGNADADSTRGHAYGHILLSSTGLRRHQPHLFLVWKSKSGWWEIPLRRFGGHPHKFKLSNSNANHGDLALSIACALHHPPPPPFSFMLGCILYVFNAPFIHTRPQCSACKPGQAFLWWVFCSGELFSMITKTRRFPVV